MGNGVAAVIGHERATPGKCSGTRARDPCWGHAQARRTSTLEARISGAPALAYGAAAAASLPTRALHQLAEQPPRKRSPSSARPSQFGGLSLWGCGHEHHVRPRVVRCAHAPPKGTTYELDTCAHQDDDQGGRYALLFIKGTDTEKEWL